MNFKRKLFLMLAIVLCINIVFNGFLIATVNAAQEKGEKHVLHIVLDGLSDKLFEDVKKAGASTPNIDMLIENGTRLSQLNTTVPSYGGAQAGLVTGVYPEARL